MRFRIFTLAVISILQVHIVHSQGYDIPPLSPYPSEIPGVEQVKICLDGTWQFNPVFEDEYIRINEKPEWPDIKVPGEWSMQGFRVDSGQAAAYFRTFDVPSDWKGKRVKLRFNGVYSMSVIYVNGKEAGSHHGGFTAFELDITDHVNIGGKNSLLLSVTNESLADSLASGSRYACHPLGGIPRSVYLFALPEINIQSFVIQTEIERDMFDTTANLITTLKVSNESDRNVKNLSYKLEMLKIEGNQLIPDSGFIAVDFPDINPGEKSQLKKEWLIFGAKLWDCENPNLYLLRCKIFSDGELVETIEEKFGFRDVEVKGNQLFVNDMPVKLRGVNRHEVYPLTGRSVPKEMYRKDIEIFREGNVNHIRTCHYPPDEALMEAADELGMFIECEGPFCWSHHTTADSAAIRDITIRQLQEMVVKYRNHPSIIFWSLANESTWTEDYELAGKAVKVLDPTRPLTFNYYPWSWVENRSEDESVCEIGSDHYPGPKGPGKYSDYHRPISFGEFVHLNAYNRYELATDVALRDKWGIYLHDMWENMYKSKGVLGGSIWAGIDDTFYWDYINPDGSIEERTVGYGTWGPIDGWRRKKPEWWGMKKTYSPIRVSDVESKGESVTFMLENRQDFSNMSRLKINWEIGQEKGIIYPDIPPHQSKLVTVEQVNLTGLKDRIKLKFTDPRGFVVDEFDLAIGSQVINYEAPNPGRKISISKEEDHEYIRININEKEYLISKTSGLIECDIFKGPNLMILPMNNGGDTQMHGPTKYYEPFTEACTDWTLMSINPEFVDNRHVIRVKGRYKEAEGTFVYTFNADESVSVKYDFKVLEDVNPRQIGIVFDLPESYENLNWKRRGYWSTYPEWHIARLEGTASASEGYEATPVGPRTKPEHEWRLDRTSIGSNDFASTKHNIVKASLTDNSGKGLEFYGNSIRNINTKEKHSRCWIEDHKIRMLIAAYSNGGSERFLRPHAEKDDLYLKKGDSIEGTVRLKIKD